VIEGFGPERADETLDVAIPQNLWPAEALPAALAHDQAQAIWRGVPIEIGEILRSLLVNIKGGVIAGLGISRV
jgi:hypothetical protein